MTTGAARERLRLAVTGTDTGVGKTVVTCALLAACAARGARVAGMKPVETGRAARDADGDANSDAARIHRAAGGVHRLEDVCPLVLAEPLAPMVAAERAGRAVDLAALDAALARLEAASDGVIVEGAGGLLVPFTRHLTLADLARRWGLDLVVVAANRLGVLNHALLTVREAERQGLRVRAVVLTEVHAGPRDTARETNAAALRALLPATPLLELPHLGEAPDDAALARAGERLLAALDGSGDR